MKMTFNNNIIPRGIIWVLIITVFIISGCSSKQRNYPRESYYIDYSIIEMMEKVNDDIMRASEIIPQFRVVSEPKPNAYARLINGDRYIIINSGMMNIIGNNEDEYAYLIAHECAHLSKDHTKEYKKHSQKINGIGDAIIAGVECIGMAFGLPLGLISSFSVDSGTELVSLKYDRDQEREADRLAIEYVIAAGYDPKAALKFHEKLAPFVDESTFSMFSTHPSKKERISALEKLIKDRTIVKKASDSPKP